MKVTANNFDFTFELNAAGSRYVAPITLAEWEPFRSTRTVPGREGQSVLLECPMVYHEMIGHELKEGQLADPRAYARSLAYFLDHRAWCDAAGFMTAS